MNVERHRGKSTHFYVRLELVKPLKHLFLNHSIANGLTREFDRKFANPFAVTMEIS